MSEIKSIGLESTLGTAHKELNEIVDDMKQFKNQYKLVSKVGQGAFGSIFTAVNIKTNTLVVLKVLPLKTKTLAEIALCNKLDNLYITKCFEFFKSNKFYYLVYEYADKGDLKHRIQNGPSLTEKEVKKIARHILRGLVYCHSLKICHNDLKLANILLFSVGDETMYKITDWGLSNSNDRVHFSTGGTPYYIAPEIYEGKGYVCDKTDMWALGVMLFYCLENRMPFRGVDLKDIKNIVTKGNYQFRKASPEAQEFIKKLLQKDPAKRLSSDEALNDPWVENNKEETIKQEEFVEIII